MRLTTVLLIASLLQVSAAGMAQKINLRLKQASLKTAIKELKSQTGYDFVYRESLLSNAKPVTIDVKNTEFAEVLEQIFANQLLSFDIENKTVVVKEKTPSFLDRVVDKVNAYLANIDARGRVLDESGKPLEGATVMLKGTNTTTKTNAKGEFVIANVPDDGVLVIRYVGYQQLEVSLKDAALPLEIKLNVATGELEEVNVTYSTGYQNIPKERATGSFSAISNKELNKIVSSNIIDKIEGAASGVLFEKNGNTQGRILIRSVATFADTSPLIILDNFPYKGSIDNINPNDIENITILKDAAAASIWGARASNGVIVITSKKAAFNQKTQISFNSNVSLTQKPRLFSTPNMSVSDYVDFEHLLFSKGIFTSDEVSPSKLALSPVVETLIAKRDGLINEQQAVGMLNEFRGRQDIRNDYLRYVYQEPVNQRYSINASGGSEVMKYYLSVGYDKGLQSIKGNTNDRLSINFNNTIKPIKNLELTTRVIFTQQERLLKSTGFSSNQFPYEQLMNEAGHAIVTRDIRNKVKSDVVSKGLLDWNYIPLDEIGKANDKFNNWDYLVEAEAKYNFFKGLNAQVKYQYKRQLGKGEGIKDQNSYEVRNLINLYTQVPAAGALTRPIPLGSIIDYSNENLNAQTARLQLNYEGNFGESHNLVAIAGAEVADGHTASNNSREYGYFQKGLSVSKIDYVTFFKNYVNNGLTSQIPNLSAINSGTERAVAYFVNAAYTFKNRYILSASVRKDGSNLFGVKTNQKWKPLWSSGVSWIVSKEPFYHINWLPELNLRFSYGFTGTVQTGNAYVTSTFEGKDVLTGLPYARINNGPNPDLRWEEVKTINIGLDFTTRNRRIWGAVEYYNRNGKDLILQAPLDPTAGYYVGSSFATLRNYANTAGRGIDVNLSFRPLNNGLIWDSSILFSYSKSKPTKIYGDVTPFAYLNAGIILNRPFTEIYAYKWMGLDASNGNPQGYFDGKVSMNYNDILNNSKAEDLVKIGLTRPPVFGSFRNSFSYKNIALNIGVTYKLGYYFRRPSITYAKGANHADYALRWKIPGDELKTTIPSIPDYTTDFSARNAFYSQSEVLMEKGDHIRLQYINLSYNLTDNSIRKLPFRNVQLSLLMSNLGLLWIENKKGIDPDAQNILQSRSYTFGLNVNF